MTPLMSARGALAKRFLSMSQKALRQSKRRTSTFPLVIGRTWTMSVRNSGFSMPAIATCYSHKLDLEGHPGIFPSVEVASCVSG